MSCRRIPRSPSIPTPRWRRLALGLLLILLPALATRVAWAAAPAAPKTVCAVTINSSDERESFQRHLPREGYRVVELVTRGKQDWLEAACHSGLRCDALVISGHFDDGTEFYADQSEHREVLTVPQMQQAACSASCSGLFSQLKEVYLFGCKTLHTAPRHEAAAEIRRSLLRSGRSTEEAERVATLLNQRYGQSNRDRLRHIFKDVPVLYGFSSQAPLGRYAGPLMERYFQTAPAGEVASGRVSPTLLNLFGPSSMISAAGLTDADPHAAFRQDLCRLVDDQPPPAQKVAVLHELLRRDVTEVRMLLDHLERLLATLGPAQRVTPDVAAALEAIERDQATRERYLEFARDADEATVHTRMMALAHQLGWLTPAQERAEFARMLGERMAGGRLGQHEVDHVCASRPEPDAALAQQLIASGAARPGQLAHTAVLACLGDSRAHERTVRALTGAEMAEVEIAQTYLRHRPLADVGELRAVTAGVARMKRGSPQLRALEALARQRLADAASLQEIAGLFPQARSLDVQRAIAAILVRADYRLLSQAELARSLRQHRLKSPDGSDVIDLLIRLLQAG